MSDIGKKIVKMNKQLNSYFIEREDEIDMLITALLSDSNAVLIGPPGVAKSALIRAIALHLNARYFEKLMTKFTTPAEIFGPISIKKLREEDMYVHKIDGYLPTAEIAFIDEIFKANSAILNSLLTIINEKLFHNGTETIKVPLRLLVGASNEVPEDESLQALYDRFLLRKVVKDITSMSGMIKLISLDKSYEEYVGNLVKISFNEIDEVKECIKQIEFPDEVKKKFISIATQLRIDRPEDIALSSRRLRNSVKVIKSYAWYTSQLMNEDIESINHQHLICLKWILWKKPDTADSISYRLAEQLGLQMEFLNKLEKSVETLKKYIKSNEITKFKEESINIYESITKTLSEPKYAKPKTLHDMYVKRQLVKLKEEVESLYIAQFGESISTEKTIKRTSGRRARLI